MRDHVEPGAPGIGEDGIEDLARIEDGRRRIAEQRHSAVLLGLPEWRPTPRVPLGLHLLVERIIIVGRIAIGELLLAKQGARRNRRGAGSADSPDEQRREEPTQGMRPPTRRERYERDEGIATREERPHRSTRPRPLQSLFHVGGPCRTQREKTGSDSSPARLENDDRPVGRKVPPGDLVLRGFAHANGSALSYRWTAGWKTFEAAFEAAA